ncbi:hypothetical protein MNB_SV-14-824 [hydrothermal vent metagenome]|uniref:SPOR domain-containing protein n=1 Tax=hydrothermal vent metagenome TaxID=652676 RepID=A0A1W1BL29_9ZZZZ
MKKIILLILLLIGIGNATSYQIVHLKKGSSLNVREIPEIRYRTTVGHIPAYATGIKIRRCKYNSQGQEWCYISYPKGGSHLEGWVRRSYLAPMNGSLISKRHIQNFLQNFYMADEENFLDKLHSFYLFPMQQYLWKRNVSLMQLRSQKVRFYKKWGKRDYRLTHLKILKRRPNYIDVQATVRWKMKGYKDFQEGKDVQKLRLIPRGNTFKVLALKNLSHYVKPKPIVVAEEDNTIAETNTTTIKPKQPLLARSKSKEVSTGYYIQVGSFFKEINPSYLNKIRSFSYPYVIQKVVKPSSDSMIRRVLIGPFSSLELAMDSLSGVREKINKNAYIQTLKP